MVKTKKKYVSDVIDNAVICCPECDDKRVYRESVDFGTRTITVGMYCPKCAAMWYLKYTLTGVDLHKQGLEATWLKST